LATDGTFKMWNLAKCINIQWSTLTIYTYERAQFSLWEKKWAWLANLWSHPSPLLFFVPPNSFI
jgi:hypothetical protein